MFSTSGTGAEPVYADGTCSRYERMPFGVITVSVLVPDACGRTGEHVSPVASATDPERAAPRPSGHGMATLAIASAKTNTARCSDRMEAPPQRGTGSREPPAARHVCARNVHDG